MNKDRPVYADLTAKQRKLMDLLLEGKLTKAECYRQAYPNYKGGEPTKEVHVMINNTNGKFYKFSQVYSDMLQEVKERTEKEKEQSILGAVDVLKFLSDVVTEKEQDTVIVPQGDGCSEVQRVPANMRDRIKAAELLGKHHVLFTDKAKIESDVPITIVNDIGDEDD
jgi:phage terminase small subunit